MSLARRDTNVISVQELQSILHAIHTLYADVFSKGTKHALSHTIGNPTKVI